jgi:hypothetical protein
MKKAYIITSAIDIDNSYPLTYSPVRSFFTAEDRLSHTIMTIASLDMHSDDETTLYLLDMSRDWEKYQNIFLYQKNLKFVSIRDKFPEIYRTITTHPNKSYCECLLLSTFMQLYRTELDQYDFLIKMSGRYFLDSSFDTSIFNVYNKDKIFYKKPREYNWQDAWEYNMVDRRVEQSNNCLRQYCSVAFGWGRSHSPKFLDIFTGIAAMLSQPSHAHYDIETLGYYFTRPFSDNIIETDWIVYGWQGTNGQFMRY